jgi:hypothetical protein
LLVKKSNLQERQVEICKIAQPYANAHKDLAS